MAAFFSICSNLMLCINCFVWFSVKYFFLRLTHLLLSSESDAALAVFSLVLHNFTTVCGNASQPGIATVTTMTASFRKLRGWPENQDPGPYLCYFLAEMVRQPGFWTIATEEERVVAGVFADAFH